MNGHKLEKWYISISTRQLGQYIQKNTKKQQWDIQNKSFHPKLAALFHDQWVPKCFVFDQDLWIKLPSLRFQRSPRKGLQVPCFRDWAAAGAARRDLRARRSPTSRRGAAATWPQRHILAGSRFGDRLSLKAVD